MRTPWVASLAGLGHLTKMFDVEGQAHLWVLTCQASHTSPRAAQQMGRLFTGHPEAAFPVQNKVQVPNKPPHPNDEVPARAGTQGACVG